jgi:hypothetical protein
VSRGVDDGEVVLGSFPSRHRNLAPDA